jgi:hypothetical protein
VTLRPELTGRIMLALRLGGAMGLEALDEVTGLDVTR